MITISNLTRSRVNKKSLKQVAEKVLKGENRKGSDLSIVLVGPTRIQSLNKKYRSKDRPTDVLAFGQSQKFPVIPRGRRELGEIIICPRVVRRNAKRFNSTFKKEMARVLIHGALHLFGYDHEKGRKQAKKMEEKQNFYLSKMFS